MSVEHRDSGVHHAWLVTGPPGSGRSNLAHAFATALLCPEGGCGECRSCVLAAAGTHPDISVLSTERVSIPIDEVREMVANSQLGSSMSRFKIMIVEDADRIAIGDRDWSPEQKRWLQRIGRALRPRRADEASDLDIALMAGIFIQHIVVVALPREIELERRRQRQDRKSVV